MHIYIYIYKVSNANIYRCKQFYISYKTHGLYCHDLTYMGKFEKTQMSVWQLGWKVTMKFIGTPTGIFRSAADFFE